MASAAYPEGWERTAGTRDGVSYHIRPVRPNDAEREREFILSLSPESRHARMMGGLSEPSPELISQFVNLDFEHRHTSYGELGTHLAALVAADRTPVWQP